MATQAIVVHENGDQYLDGQLIATGIPNARGLRRLLDALVEFAWEKEQRAQANAAGESA